MHNPNSVEPFHWNGIPEREILGAHRAKWPHDAMNAILTGAKDDWLRIWEFVEPLDGKTVGEHRFRVDFVCDPFH